MKLSRKEEIITSMRKNIIKIGAIVLLSAFALTACDDDIIAKPTGYDENSPVVDINGTTDIYNNNFTDIYDSIRSSNVPSDVLDQLLYQYSVSVFGNYDDVTANSIAKGKGKENFGEITLKDAFEDLQTTERNKAKEFINSHSAYWTKDKEGNRVRAEGQAEDEVTAAEFARLEGKWKTIEKRIAQKMYSLISGGSYSEENVFDEAKFVRSLDSSIENNVTEVKTFKGVLTAQVEDYDVFTEPSKKLDGTDDVILHRENYQNYEKDGDGKEKATYIQDKIIPDIYRQLLVEQYILDKSYDTLGRTSARHISVLSITKSSKYAKGAADLMNTYVNDYIFSDPADPKTIDLKSFKMVSDAWIGTFMNEEHMANYIADPAANADQISAEAKEKFNLMNSAIHEYLVNDAEHPNPYFQGTAYGDMMEEIEKINDNPKLSENEGTYTGSGAYTVEVGKEIKTRELELKDNTTTGWYIKSVGVSALPESIKSQLFDINVANALSQEKDSEGNLKYQCVEYTKENGEWTTNVAKLEAEEKSTSGIINVVGKVNGNYFLRNTTSIKGNPVQSDILFESDGTYYIVLVEDAIRSKNLDKRGINEFDDDQLDTLETYINEIVQIVGNNDTYKNLSKKHWLKEMNIKYHDTKVYEYFKSNFPELFEDD